MRTLRRVAISLIVSSAATAGLAITMATPAAAHHPDLTVATGGCVDGHEVINVTATAWETPDTPRRVNHSIGISVDGVQVATGAFLPENNYSFSLVIPTTPGTHVVRATALVPWGPNEEYTSDDPYRESTVTVEACPTTTTATPTTEAAITTVQVKGTEVTTAPATTAEPGSSTSAPTATKELPRTGSDNEGVVFLAIGLLLGGATLLGVERRMRTARKRS
ncbi:MAG: LPXTG cell wall anchor domain-containing protein [Acidimicrobiia bacterium]